MDKIIQGNQVKNFNLNKAQTSKNKSCLVFKENKITIDNECRSKSKCYNENNHIDKSNATLSKHDNNRPKASSIHYLSKKKNNKRYHRDKSTVSSSTSYNIHKSIDTLMQNKEEREKEKEREIGKFDMKYSQCSSKDQLTNINRNSNRKNKENQLSILKQKVDNGLIEEGNQCQRNQKALKERYFQEISILNDNKKAKLNKSISSLIKKIQNNTQTNHNYNGNNSKRFNKSNSSVQISEIKNSLNDMNNINESRKKLNDYYNKKEIKGKEFPFYNTSLITQKDQKKSMNVKKPIANFMKTDIMEQMDNQFSFRKKEVNNYPSETEELHNQINKQLEGDIHHYKNNNNNLLLNKNTTNTYAESYQTHYYNFDYSLYQKVSHNKRLAHSFQCILDDNDNLKTYNYVIRNNIDQTPCFGQKYDGNANNKHSSNVNAPLIEKNTRLDDLEQIKILAYNTQKQKEKKYSLNNGNNNSIQHRPDANTTDKYINDTPSLNHNIYQHCCNDHRNHFCFHNDRICCCNFLH